MITWRDAIARLHEKVNKAEMEMMQHVEASRVDRQKIDRNDYVNDLVGAKAGRQFWF